MKLKENGTPVASALRAQPARAKTPKAMTASDAQAKDRKPGRTRHHRESPDVRRKALIQATMRSIAKYGYAGTTIGRICAEAQVSRGLINHHFGTKEELIRQSYMELCEEWSFQTRDMLLDTHSDPEEKLRAMIRVSFGPTVFKQDHLGIWVGFWSVIGKSPTLKKLNRELYKQDRETYQKAFEEIAIKLGKTIDSRRAAIALGALMDGLWLEWCLDPKGFTPEEAEGACMDLVTRTFA
ncbi:MAG: TetR family transcriptional regulator C-terminal domain-containing protein [Burkholderiaceae bacterium]|jgi:AcrR family transcriptional regulator